MLFLVANTVATRPPPTPIPPPPSPTVIVTQPPPTPLPRLELKFTEFTLSVDPDGLLRDNTAAINSVIQQIKAQSFLKGRSAGLVIVYAGAPDDTQINSALNVASKVYAIMATKLGQQYLVFSRASYYTPLYLFGVPRSQVVVDVYLFAQQ